MFTRIERVEVFAQYGQDGFIHYTVRYCSGRVKTYYIHSHFKPCAAEKHIPKTVLSFIRTSEISYTEDILLFHTEPVKGHKIPCGFVKSIYCNCPF